MNSSRDRILFWCLIAAQAAGSQVVIWSGVPIYKRLRSAAGEGIAPKEVVLVLAAVVLMQTSHWFALSLGRRLQFRRNIVLGHVLIWIGELSLFFIAAVATIILFDRFGEWEFVLWKALLLAATLFAVTSYKYQLMSLGTAMIETEPDASNDRVRMGSGDMRRPTGQRHGRSKS